MKKKISNVFSVSNLFPLRKEKRLFLQCFPQREWLSALYAIQRSHSYLPVVACRMQWMLLLYRNKYSHWDEWSRALSGFWFLSRWDSFGGVDRELRVPCDKRVDFLQWSKPSLFPSGFCFGPNDHYPPNTVPFFPRGLLGPVLHVKKAMPRRAHHPRSTGLPSMARWHEPGPAVAHRIPFFLN